MKLIELWNQRISSDRAFATIETIASAPGINEKVAIVKRHADELAWYLIAIYDPYTTYGVKNINLSDRRIGTGSARREFDETEYRLLQQLASRELTGLSARDAIERSLADLSISSAKLLIRILKKDMRAGITAKSINKAIPGLIHQFNVQSAELFDPSRATYPSIIQPKYDGYRMVARVDLSREEKDIQLLSKKGSPFETFDLFKGELRSLATTLETNDDVLFFDGEVISSSFLQIASVARSTKNKITDSDAVFMVFDLFSSSLKRLSLRNRLERLSAMFEKAMTHSERRVILAPTRWVINEKDVMSHYQRYRNMGYEGAMLKDPTAYYEEKRSYSWMKLKDERSLEGIVVAVVPGEVGKKYESTLGALVVQIDKGKLVNVATGFSDQDRNTLWSQFLANPNHIVGRVVEVIYHEKTPSGSLRHPRFKRFRDVVKFGEVA